MQCGMESCRGSARNARFQMRRCWTRQCATSWSTSATTTTNAARADALMTMATLCLLARRCQPTLLQQHPKPRRWPRNLRGVFATGGRSRCARPQDRACGGKGRATASLATPRRSGQRNPRSPEKTGTMLAMLTWMQPWGKAAPDSNRRMGRFTCGMAFQPALQCSWC